MSIVKYMPKKQRRLLLFAIALSFARKKGLFSFSLQEVAKSGGCSVSTVKKYFGGISKLRSEIIRYGIIKDISWIKETSILDLANL